MQLVSVKILFNKKGATDPSLEDVMWLKDYNRLSQDDFEGQVCRLIDQSNYLIATL